MDGDEDVCIERMLLTIYRFRMFALKECLDPKL
jgi:hypothetical protein